MTSDDTKRGISQGLGAGLVVGLFGGWTLIPLGLAALFGGFKKATRTQPQATPEPAPPAPEPVLDPRIGKRALDVVAHINAEAETNRNRSHLNRCWEQTDGPR